MCYIFFVTEPDKRGRGRPKKPGGPAPTPVRTLRIGELWDEAEKIAEARKDKMADIVRPSVERALKRYISQHRSEA